MYEDDFQKLKDSLNTTDDLEKLHILGDLLEKISDYIMEANSKNRDIPFLTESVRRQNIIYDYSDLLSDKLISMTKEKNKKEINERGLNERGLNDQEMDGVSRDRIQGSDGQTLETVAEQLKTAFLEFKDLVVRTDMQQS